MTHQDKLLFKTDGHGHMHNITREVQMVVEASGIRTGIVNVSNHGSTGVVAGIEYEPGLARDLPAALDRLFPPDGTYAHEDTWNDGNGHSHLQASVAGQSLTLPVTDSELNLGPYQQVVHLECDTCPHHREVIVTVYGD